VNSSLVDGTPRLWGGWYGRTLYVTDRNGVNQWQKSFGGSYEAAGVYAGDLLGNGTDALLVGGATGSGIQIDAARLSDGATLWTFTDNTAYWSSHVIAIGDADTDGSNEVAIWSGGNAGLGRSPKYQVLNGSTGSRLWEQGYPNDTSMLQHARLVDVNNDGRKEILLAVNNTIEARDAQTGELVKSYTVSGNVTTFEVMRADPLEMQTRIAGNGFTIQFPTISGRRYRIESTDDLSSGNWTRVVQDNIIGSGDVMQVTDRNAMSAQRRFYRIVLY
jgi:hypothetical protein